MTRAANSPPGRALRSRARLLGVLSVLLATLSLVPSARADDDPVFPGHPDLSRYTKELGFEVTSSLTDAGPVLGGGIAVAAYYSRFLSSFAAAMYSPRSLGPRERWEARGGGRLVYPEPLFGRVFGFLSGGGGLLFTAVDGEEATFRRALIGIGGMGLFSHVTDHVRVRLELREHLRLFGVSDTRHAFTFALGVIVVSR